MTSRVLLISSVSLSLMAVCAAWSAERMKIRLTQECRRPGIISHYASLVLPTMLLVGGIVLCAIGLVFDTVHLLVEAGIVIGCGWVVVGCVCVWMQLF